jgi:hypothetical protein
MQHMMHCRKQKMPSDECTCGATARYKQRFFKQVENWTKGKSEHNKIDDECCPDFSCCYPDLFEQDREKRINRLNYFRERDGMVKHFDA